MMKIIKASRGSTEDMLNAFQDKLEDLGASTDVTATSGSSADMLDAFYTKLDELDSCSGVEGDDILSDEDFNVIDDDYINQMASGIKSEVENEVDAVSELKDAGSSLKMNVVYSEDVINFDIPKEDLTGDLEGDIAYVVNSILEELDDTAAHEEAPSDKLKGLSDEEVQDLIDNGNFKEKMQALDSRYARMEADLWTL